MVSTVTIVACWLCTPHAGGEYPLTLVVDAQAKRAATTVVSALTIRVERLMEENRRTRVTDALKYGGYANFLTALRALPAVGTIELDARKVDLRYAHEQTDERGRRLILVADRPLFFFGDPSKARAGYELTIVELRFDQQGGATGTMAGAARVKPAPGDGVVLDDYAESPVQLAGRLRQP